MEDSVRSNPDLPPRIDTVGVLLRHWLFIAIWVIIVTIAAVLLALRLPSRYEATAYLLINPSPYKSSTLEQPPLEVDVYERMLLSPALVERVKNRLVDEELTVEKLLRQMDVGLIQRRNIRETTYAPMILLQVRDVDAARSRDIANAWADEAASSSLELKSAVSRQVNDRIKKQFEDTSELLERLEDDCTSFKIHAQLVEKKAELETVRKQLTTEQEKLNQLLVDYSASEARLKELKRRYDSFFVDGVWVGTLYGVEEATTDTVDPTKIKPETLQFLLARNDMVEKSRKFTDYKIQKRVDIIKRQYQILINKILRFEQDIEDMRLRLATEKAKLAALQEEEASVPERLTVAKAITDDALWEQYGRVSGRTEDLTSNVLVTEEINPVWLSVQGRMKYLKPEIASLEARLESFNSLLVQLQTEQADLDSTVVVQTQNAANLETEMLLAKQRYEELFQIFLQVSHGIMFEEGIVAGLEEEIEDSKLQVDRLTTTSSELNEYTVMKEMEQERLQRELTTLKNIHTALAEKYQEARILELEVSGDLQVWSKAVLPQGKAGSTRGIQIVAAAFMASLIFFSLLVLAREYMRRQPA